jgi:hypothetical protein
MPSHTAAACSGLTLSRECSFGMFSLTFTRSAFKPCFARKAIAYVLTGYVSNIPYSKRSGISSKLKYAGDNGLFTTACSLLQVKELLFLCVEFLKLVKPWNSL